jgi:8-oxo-dGTP pyrophosphatase MutT (NUDIX family)
VVQPLSFDAAARGVITRNLDRFAARRIDDASLNHAAVCLIVADDGGGDCALLITRRASHLNRHAGQFALPGGRVDAGESAIDAGLREAREEINLELGPGAILGRLDDFPTRSGYAITPLVVWAPPGATMSANPAEVAHLYRVHLAEFHRPGSPEFVSIPESDRPVIRYPLLNTEIYAPTAAVMYQFIEVAVQGRDTRVAHFEQPLWAWR